MLNQLTVAGVALIVLGILLVAFAPRHEMTVEDFVKLWRENPNKAPIEFLGFDRKLTDREIANSFDAAVITHPEIKFPNTEGLVSAYHSLDGGDFRWDRSGNGNHLRFGK